MKRGLAGLMLAAFAAAAFAEDEDRAGQAVGRPASSQAMQTTRQPPLDGALWRQRLRTAAAFERRDDEHNPLAVAAAGGADAIVRELLKRGAELDRIGADGFSAIGAAAFHGRRSTLRLLLRAGADARRGDATGQTALHLAALAGQLDSLDELLRAGVDIELLNRQRESALDVAAVAGQQEAMSRLIDAGADLTRAGQR